MTCEKCVNNSMCTKLSETDDSLAHKMWMYEFWGNAPELCKEFALVINGEDTQDDKS